MHELLNDQAGQSPHVPSRERRRGRRPGDRALRARTSLARRGRGPAARAVARRRTRTSRQSQQHLHDRREEPGNRAGHQDGAAADHRRRVRRRLGAGLDQAGGPGSEVRPQTEGGSRAIPSNYQNMRLVGAGGTAPDAERRRGAVERAGERTDDRQRHREARGLESHGDLRVAGRARADAADAGSRRGRSRAQESARLQDHRQAHPRRRQPRHRDGQGRRSASSRAAGRHAATRSSRSARSSVAKSSAPTSTRSRSCRASSTRSSSSPRARATTLWRPASRSSPTAGGWPTTRAAR